MATALSGASSQARRGRILMLGGRGRRMKVQRTGREGSLESKLEWDLYCPTLEYLVFIVSLFSFIVNQPEGQRVVS